MVSCRFVIPQDKKQLLQLGNEMNMIVYMIHLYVLN